jgi:hypothetical protein
MPMVKRKKAKVRARARTGLAGAPIDKGFDAVKYYFHIEVDRKDLINTLKSYIKSNVDSKNQKFALSNPEYKFYIFTHYCATAFWINSGLKLDEKSSKYAEGLYKYVMTLVESGKDIYFEKQAKLKDSATVVSLSPMQRLQKKISNTIMQDLLDLEDKWIDGEKAELDIYQEFKRHGLTGAAVASVRQVIEGWLLDYEDAYHKRCEDAVEGYAHLKRPELNRRIKACQDMLADCDRIRSAAKATRATRVKQPKAADKQVAKVQYKKEDTEFKLVSIPPIKIVGGTRLYTFNTKTRALTEYITQDVKGFEISGTSIKNIDKVNSRTVKLRKPDAFLPIVLGKTPNQIDKEWKTLTTKTSIPNGRLGSDTILLRVLDK